MKSLNDYITLVEAKYDPTASLNYIPQDDARAAIDTPVAANPNAVQAQGGGKVKKDAFATINPAYAKAFGNKFAPPNITQSKSASTTQAAPPAGTPAAEKKWPVTPDEIKAFQKTNKEVNSGKPLAVDGLIGRETMMALVKQGYNVPIGFQMSGYKNPQAKKKTAPRAQATTAPTQGASVTPPQDHTGSDMAFKQAQIAAQSASPGAVFKGAETDLDKAKREFDAAKKKIDMLQGGGATQYESTELDRIKALINH